MNFFSTKKFFYSCKNLEYNEKPNYSKLREIFRNLFLKRGYVYDYRFDWVVKKEKENELSQQLKRNNSATNKEKEWVENLFKNAIPREKSISNEKKSNLEEKEKNTNEENKKNNSKVDEKEKEKEKEKVYKENEFENENIFNKLEEKDKKLDKKENQDKQPKIEKVNSENQETNNIETNTEEFKIDENMIKKIQKLKTLTKERKKRHNPKLKVLIEQKLNEKSKIIFTNREKLFSSFETKEEHEKRKKDLSLYFIRKEEISRDQHKYIYHKIHKIKKLLKSNPKIENPLITKQFLQIKSCFKQKLSFDQILILHNQIKELKFIVDQRNEFLKEKNSKENMILQSQNLIFSTKKLNKIKNDQIKHATNERVKKLFETKIAVFDHIKKLDILQNDEIQKKKIKKIEKKLKKTVSQKVLVKLYDEINVFLIDVQGRLKELNN
ncbi:casein kinase i-like [Anaeramoeba flamelloides]|uniref:Casein kinase i-like n=1 Tax=Anaeramoeba flamelloides TaxID=1746091 RepID=A0ABQ8Z8Z1_9EUKA|nr:casein kinase i-like [Anaeramoeba flamelloides]